MNRKKESASFAAHVRNGWEWAYASQVDAAKNAIDTNGSCSHWSPSTKKMIHKMNALWKNECAPFEDTSPWPNWTSSG